jgi:hypothetical protein
MVVAPEFAFAIQKEFTVLGNKIGREKIGGSDFQSFHFSQPVIHILN